jgi:hypothetical protein
MAPQSLYNLEPLTCWHCEKPHSESEAFCVICNGWTLPTRTRGSFKARVIIEWKTFVILASDSEEAKGNLMRDAMVAIENNKYVAVLGIKIKIDRWGQEIKEKAVFLHRAGGDKRLSVSKTKFHASSRWWSDIDSDQDWVWKAFKQIVGKEIKIVIYSSKDSNNLVSRRKQ